MRFKYITMPSFEKELSNGHYYNLNKKKSKQIDWK